MIEPKGIDAFMVRNNVRVIIATNNDWVVPAGVDDRRFLVLDVDDSRRQDHAYFEALHEEIENGGQAALMHYLLQYDLTGVHLRQVPKTEALLEQKLRSMGSVDKFWVGRLYQGELEAQGHEYSSSAAQDWTKQGTVVPTAQLYQSYVAHTKELGSRHPEQQEQFGKRLKQLCPSLEKVKRSRVEYGKKRVWCYQFPPTGECRHQFEEIIGQEIDWESDR